MTQISQSLEAFQWQRQPQAQAAVRDIVDEFLRTHDLPRRLAQRMTDETGTRFFDWIDSIELAADGDDQARLIAAGFTWENAEKTILRHTGGMFPRVLIGERLRVMLKVDSVADFLAANGLETPILGEPFAPLRMALLADELMVVERRGWTRFTLAEQNAVKQIRAAQHLEHFRRRRRDFADDAAGFERAHALVDAAIAEIGVDQTCALFFMAEREFWQRRNRAAQVQKARQDILGLGWGNHDHHTYRSSRVQFVRLIALHEKLGLVCRERFYAGREAGWGAQVMENPNAGIITFNDVDLAPEELLGDFAHEPLPPRATLGTVGLWCGLHGEAFLQAGMHHLECQFDFAALKQQLEKHHGISVMKPFTDYPYLRQAFTEGERWPVADERIARLLQAKLITEAQADKFRREGALGSHLENLERNEGFKGFNQKGVSEIIAATDPRVQQN